MQRRVQGCAAAIDAGKRGAMRMLARCTRPHGGGAAQSARHVAASLRPRRAGQELCRVPRAPGATPLPPVFCENPTMSDAPVHHALVTGASSGIGAAIAREYARRGRPLILTARRTDRLDALAAELRAQVDCVVIAADLARSDAPQQLFDAVRERGLHVSTLVNNAGYGVPGSYLASDWSVHAQFLQVMVTAVSELTWRFLPQIRKSGAGRILNIASFAGLSPGSRGQTLYAGTKSYLVKFSESLALENADAGVQVCALCPGFTYSEFHDVTGTRGLVSQLPKWMWLDTDEVARQGVDGVEQGRLIVVPGFGYKVLRQVIKHLPDGAARRLMAKNTGRIRDAR